MTHAEIHIRAFDAIQVLEHRAKLAAQEHRERIKRLRGLMHAIAVQRMKGEIDMMVDATSLAPELERLLDDPTAGL
jgi:hypothetical protein